MHAMSSSYVNMFAASICLYCATVWLFSWRKSGANYKLVMALFWISTCVWTSFLAVSAGPAPLIDRGDMAGPIRLVEIIVFSFAASGHLGFFRSMWQASQHKERLRTNGIELPALKM